MQPGLKDLPIRLNLSGRQVQTSGSMLRLVENAGVDLSILRNELIKKEEKSVIEERFIVGDVEQYLRTIIIVPNVDPIDFFHSLNFFEKMTLRLLVQGENYTSISEELHRTEGTIQEYVRGIRKKLGASSKQEAIEFAKAAGVR